MKKILFIIIYVSTLTIINCDSSTDPGKQSDSTQKEILILEDNGTQETIATILSNAGYNVKLGGPYWMYTGDDINDYQLVILLNGVEWNFEMPDSVQQRIRDYVESGGALFSIEWITWSGATNQIINDMLPVYYGGSWSASSEMYKKVINHPISTALPDSFYVPNDWSYSITKLDTLASKEAKIVFEGSKSGAAVATGRFGEGTTIHWNMGGHYNGTGIWSTEVTQLLKNIADFGINE
ncbi:hypothetical protein ACFL5H_03370 [Candidatus Latescibacterota bacterium]